MRRLTEFLRDQRGNTAIIFGLAAIPLVALGGGGIDFAQRARIHGAIQSASDTAALAAARLVQDGMLKRSEEWADIKAQAEDMAQKLVIASLADFNLDDAPAVHITVTQEKVDISAQYDMKTAFLDVVGIDQLPTATFAEVAVPDPVLVEMTFVLDYSLSMHQNNKYQRMTTAARDFIAKVKANRGDRTKIGIVPFSEFVYADIPNVDVRDPETGGTHAWDGGSTFDGGWNWSGGSTTTTTEETGTSAVCLVNRDYPYSTTDETPTGLEATQWQQADPDSDRCKKYQTGGLKARDLTDDFDGLSNALAGMQPVGWTNIALGAEIGWHMLSPNEPFETRAQLYRSLSAEDHGASHRRRADHLRRWGRLARLPSTAPTSTTAELCENAKASKVTIYTIAYDVDDTSVYDLLSGCASSAERLLRGARFLRHRPGVRRDLRSDRGIRPGSAADPRHQAARARSRALASGGDRRPPVTVVRRKRRLRRLRLGLLLRARRDRSDDDPASGEKREQRHGEKKTEHGSALRRSFA